jgi:hypothetical protein
MIISMNQAIESLNLLLPKAFICRILGLSASAVPNIPEYQQSVFGIEETQSIILHLVFRDRRPRVFTVTAWEKGITAAR